VFGLEQSEVGEGGGFGFECGDGFDEAGDGEGVADAAGTADQAEHAAFAGELDGDAHERGDAGAVDLRMPLRRTTTFFAPALITDWRASCSCSAGSPMVSRPWTSSTDTPPDWRTLISMGGRSVMAVGQTILIERRWPFAMPHGIIRRRVSCTKGTVLEV